MEDKVENENQQFIKDIDIRVGDDSMMDDQNDTDKSTAIIDQKDNDSHLESHQQDISSHLESLQQDNDSHPESGFKINDQLHDMKNGSDFYLEENEKLLCNKAQGERDVNEQILPQSEELVETKIVEVPDGGYGWMVVFSSYMVHFIIGGIERSAGLLYLQFLDRYQETAAVTAWLTAIAAGVRLMLGPLTGALSHRFSCRSTIMLGGLLTCVSMVLSGFAPNLYFQFFSFGVLGGIGRSFAYCPAVVIVGLYFNKKRGRAVGIATSGVGFGTFVLPPIIELCFNHYGFSGAFWMIGALTFNLTVLGILMRPLSVHRKIESIQTRQKQQLITGDVEATLLPKPKRKDDNLYDSVDFTIPVLKENQRMKKISSFSNFKRRISSAVLFTTSKPKSETKVKEKRKLFEFSLLKDYRFACFCVAILLFTTAFQSAFVFLPPYVKQIGGSSTKAAFIIVIAGVFDGIGRIVAGFVLDMKQIKPYRYFIYNGIMLIMCCISMIIPSLKDYIPLGIVCAFYGFFTGSYISQKSVIIVDLLGPEKLTYSFGIMILFQGIGMAIGPLMGGLLKDINGTYDYAFYFGGCAMFVGFSILIISNVFYCLTVKK